MFQSEPMIKVRMVFLRKHLDLITHELGKLGIVHLVNAVDQSIHHWLTHLDLKEEYNECLRLYEKAKMLCLQLGIERNGSEESIQLDLSQLKERINQIEQEFRTAEDQIEKLIEQSGTLTAEIKRTSNLPFRRIRMTALQNLQYLSMWCGSISLVRFPELVHALADRALVLRQPDNNPKVQILIISHRAAKWQIESELKKLGFEPLLTTQPHEETAEETLNRLHAQLKDVQEALKKHQQKISELGKVWRSFLLGACVQLEENLLVLEAKQHYGEHGGICGLSGWIPVSARQQLVDRIEEITQGTALIDFVEPNQDTFVQSGKEKVPIKFKKYPWLDPFRQLILMFGPPRYDEVEPSLFVAVSFVLMFGVMFGDIGQGLVLTLSGLFCLTSKHSKFKNAGYWLIFCGFSSVIFGVLTGSFFGFEYHTDHRPTPDWLAWLPKPILQPMNDPMTLFALCLGLGVVLITLAMLINTWNRFRHQAYAEGIFAQFGLVGVILYLGSIGLGIKSLVGGAPTLVEVVILIVLPLIMLLFREPIIELLKHKKVGFHEGIFSFIMTALIELLETVNGFLSSTVSFARLGGFALSHAALCLAVYEIAGILKHLPAGNLWFILTVMIGNIFIILLEGLIVSIQSIRLEYYELFSKYFSGDGILYRPFCLWRKQEPR